VSDERSPSTHYTTVDLDLVYSIYINYIARTNEDSGVSERFHAAFRPRIHARNLNGFLFSRRRTLRERSVAWVGYKQAKISSEVLACWLAGRLNPWYVCRFPRECTQQEEGRYGDQERRSTKLFEAELLVVYINNTIAARFMYIPHPDGAP
jgi:hypothetical protein